MVKGSLGCRNEARVREHCGVGKGKRSFKQNRLNIFRLSILQREEQEAANKGLEALRACRRKKIGLQFTSRHGTCSTWLVGWVYAEVRPLVFFLSPLFFNFQAIMRQPAIAQWLSTLSREGGQGPKKSVCTYYQPPISSLNEQFPFIFCPRKTFLMWVGWWVSRGWPGPHQPPHPRSLST